jgi:hypothetical protein
MILQNGARVNHVYLESEGSATPYHGSAPAPAAPAAPIVVIY